MTPYQQRARDFLQSANATMEIRFIGQMRNTDWKETALRNAYDVTLKTPRGAMALTFWDSIHNTEIASTTLHEYAKKRFKCEYRYLTLGDQRKAAKELKAKKAAAAPTEYDILACITKDDPGTFEGFCADFGYDEDSRTAERIYFACQREYKQLSRLFTSEQMEALAEIY